MVKKSRGKQRGIQQFSVRKHKVRLHFDIEDLSPIKGNYDDKISKLSLKTWLYLSFLCTKLNLIPLKISPGGQWVLCSPRRRVVHYAVVALVVAMIIRQLLQSVSYLGVHGFNLNSTAGLCFLMYYVAACSAAIASSFTTTKMVDLMNSWQPQIDWIEETTGNAVSIYSRTSDNIKIILTTIIFHLVSMELAVGSVLLPDVPSTWYGLVRSLELDPTSEGSALLLRVFLAPVEFGAAVAVSWVGSYNIGCGTLSLALIRIYFTEMRYDRDFLIS